MPALSYIKVARPKQWSKNLLVFAALLFTGSFKDSGLVAKTLLAFAAMSLISSATYIVNDLIDLERDRQHPKKSKRPLAAGEVSPAVAVAMAVVFAGISLAISASLGRASLFIIVIYLVLQVAYNGGLKKVPVADVFVISLGFILRAVLGAVAISAPISSWLLFCTGGLALMLGFGKRRNEFVVQGEDRSKTRESLEGYNLAALDALVTMASVGAALSYALYVIQSDTGHRFPGLIFTSPFVFYGISRYVYLVFKQGEGGEPENLLFRDRHILFTIIGFTIFAILAVKGFVVHMVDFK